MSISAKKSGINYTTAFITQITAKAMSAFMAKSMTALHCNLSEITRENIWPKSWLMWQKHCGIKNNTPYYLWQNLWLNNPWPKWYMTKSKRTCNTKSMLNCMTKSMTNPKRRQNLQQHPLQLRICTENILYSPVMKHMKIWNRFWKHEEEL